MKSILVVDDEQSMREMLSIMLHKEGFEILAAHSRAQAAAVLGRRAVDMVITDVRLPDGDGIEILRHVKAASPETVVIVMTAYGSPEMAVAAMRLGAHDYLTKPFDVDELRIVVRNALEKHDLEEENRRLKAEFRARHGLDRMLGLSPAMTGLFTLIRSVAPTAATVLVTGESGTGKELVAKAIHALSPRHDGPFVSINCGAVPETLLESELFGHMKGAFTDAHQNKKGLFEAAHRGTLLLDEVGTMPASMQVRLLRALQEHKIRRVGGTTEVEVDARIIAATNEPLEGLVEQRRFREDLFYRLNVIPMHVPALRERPEDIPILAEHFLDRFRKEMGKDVATISAEAMSRLTVYDWPGNVRELENAMERAVALETSPSILPERLTLRGRRAAGGQSEEIALGQGFSLDAHLLQVEQHLVQRALAEADGDRDAASRLLGISGRSLRYLIGKHHAAHPGMFPDKH